MSCRRDAASRTGYRAGATAAVQRRYAEAYYACMNGDDGTPPPADGYAYTPPLPAYFPYAPYPYAYPYYYPPYYYGPAVTFGFGFGSGYHGGFRGGRGGRR